MGTENELNSSAVIPATRLPTPAAANFYSVHSGAMFSPTHLVQVQSADSPDSTVHQVTGLWERPEVQQWLVQTPLKILLVLVIALILHGVTRRLIDRAAKANIHRSSKRSSLGRKKDDSPTGADDPRLTAMKDAREQRRRSRIKTLAGVAKSAAAIVIWVWAGLAILDEVGVNVGPVIASAGVVGLALGFGAQALVKDFLSGIFMLLEDQYGVGDVVDLGEGIVGDVEEISLRITTVRDIDGTLWYVRNGEILRVGNLSDEYSIARIEIPIALSNDMDAAWDTILAAVKEAAQHPLISDAIIDDPYVNGLTEINPDSVTFRASVKTLPSRQWDVQRIISSRLINQLRERGVDLPYPNGIGFHPRADLTRPATDEA